MLIVQDAPHPLFMDLEANSFDSSSIRVSLSGTWERPVDWEWEPEGREMIHFTPEGRAFQFFVVHPAKPDWRKRFELCWAPVSGTGFYITMKPDGPVTRHGNLEGDLLTVANEDSSWQTNFRRVAPEQMPVWFRHALAAALKGDGSKGRYGAHGVPLRSVQSC